MPYIAYLFFSSALIAFTALLWVSNQMREDITTAVICMGIGSILTIIILAKLGVDLR
tara:strand:+ start:42 stop:212 length:171 start_codon:yes stop_codon:yes gene_type:complete